MKRVHCSNSRYRAKHFWSQRLTCYGTNWITLPRWCCMPGDLYREDMTWEENLELGHTEERGSLVSNGFLPIPQLRKFSNHRP